MPHTCKKARNQIVDCKIDTGKKIFYAADKLASLFTAEQIKAILDCDCYPCEQDRLNRSDASAKEYIEWITKDAVSLFGLFVKIEHPQLIAKILQNGWNDRDFIGSLTRADSTSANTVWFNIQELQQKYWPELMRDDNSESKRVADDFRDNMFAFAVPTIESGELQNYSEGTVLPFINEQKLDNNSSTADVWSFEIYRGYRSESVRRDSFFIQLDRVFIAQGLTIGRSLLEASSTSSERR